VVTSTNRSRPRSARRALAATLAVAAVAVAVGCTTAEEQAAPTDPCRSFIDRASAAAELSEQVELLDTALVVCSSVETFTVNVERYPALLGWDVSTYLQNRCTTVDDDAIRGSRICTASVVTTTTIGPVDVPDVVYVGTTLDGRDVEIRPRAGRPFDNGTPQVITGLADIAAATGCDGVEAELERWTSQIDDPVIGDEASVYAQYALDVLAFIQCDQ
jgi:hypothetical protein